MAKPKLIKDVIDGTQDTTIRLSKNTRNRLLEIGSKMETYEDIILRLLDATKQKIKK